MKLVAHGDADGFVPGIIAKGVEYARALANEKKIDVPPGAFSYFFGHRDNGARFLVGARMTR